MSIKTNGNCIHIYQLPGCNRTGKNLMLQTSKPYLTFDGDDYSQQIRSIDSCDAQKKEEDSSMGAGAVTNVLLLIAGIMVATGSVALVHRRRNHKHRQRRKLTEEEAQEILYTSNLQEDRVPYDPNLYEIPRDHLRIGTLMRNTKLLGHSNKRSLYVCRYEETNWIR